MLSIIIPTFNRKNMLKEAIESIRDQTYKNIEIIVIDDCSLDGTEEMLQEYIGVINIKYFKNNKNKGPGYNRNLGFNESSGKYIIFMDDDDYYIEKTYFERAISKLEKENFVFISGNAYIDNIKTGKREKGKIGIKGKIAGIDFILGLHKNYEKPLSTFTTIFRKQTLIKADLKNMKMVNDYAIYMRVLLFGEIFILEDYIGVYRLHGENISYKISADFLIENLNERFWVRERLEKKINDFQLKKWWNWQMILLLRYYLFGSNPTYKNLFKVSCWILKNSQFSFILWIKILKLILINKLVLNLKKLKGI